MAPVNSAEAKVAKVLRDAGINIECNVFINSFEVDIVAERRLIIEVDGYHHYARNTIKRDQTKEDCLVQAGYQLMRIKNADVHDQDRLKDFVEQVKSQLAARPGAAIPVYTPFASPNLVQLKDQLLAKEAAKLDQLKQRKSPPATKQKSDRALFLEWLDKEPAPDKEESRPPQRRGNQQRQPRHK